MGSELISLADRRDRHGRRPAAGRHTPTVVVAVAGLEADPGRLRAALENFLATEFPECFADDTGTAMVERTAGDVRLDVAGARVHVAGAHVMLTGQEFRLLQAFLEHPAQVLGRRQLLALAWNTDTVFCDARTVDVHVRRLRVKLATSATTRIATVRGFGYRLDVDG